MNKYLTLLKRMEAERGANRVASISEKSPHTEPPKPPKVLSMGLGGFGGYPSDHFSKNHDAANDPSDASQIPEDCAGALQEPNGGLFLPWGPCLSSDDVRRLRADLVGMIETVAHLEGWDAGRWDDVLTRAIRGPLADLLPNIAHFTERLSEARADAQARDAIARKSWRYE